MGHFRGLDPSIPSGFEVSRLKSLVARLKSLVARLKSLVEGPKMDPFGTIYRRDRLEMGLKRGLKGPLLGPSTGATG